LFALPREEICAYIKTLGPMGPSSKYGAESDWLYLDDIPGSSRDMREWDAGEHDLLSADATMNRRAEGLQMHGEEAPASERPTADAFLRCPLLSFRHPRHWYLHSGLWQKYTSGESQALWNSLVAVDPGSSETIPLVPLTDLYSMTEFQAGSSDLGAGCSQSISVGISLPSGAALAFFFFLPRMTRATPAARARNASVTPMPMPAFAPVLRPEDGVFGAGVVVGTRAAVEFALELAVELVVVLVDEVSVGVAVGLVCDVLLDG
jgi:hypothetical protein